ncbi:Putative Arginine/ornithine antiporter [endosymbiont DhMRE of Dentiscutata heterogama]|nr:Putative Arginine/ornithine antiporter [endosymbiont DhMRE of Dentiscutata heterogama]
MFFLITFAISILTIFLTWIPSLAKTKVGITDIFPHFLKTAGERLAGQGLSIFAFAFFLHAILQSQAFQALFASKRKWLQKRKYFTIGLITICAALLSSNLSWFDEFVHFYPLVIPLLLAMGFDFFSSFLCLYGGSVAGLLGLVSTERITTHFNQCFSEVKGKINYTGLTGIGFRVASLALFASIIILFNIWYCSRHQQASAADSGNLSKEGPPPRLNRTRKLILAVAGFFLLGSFFAQAPWVAKKLDGDAARIPEYVTNVETKEEYEKLGTIEEMKVTRIKEEKVKNWGTFGKWEEQAVNCWLIIGGIIICLLAKQSIMKNLITAIQNSIPLLLIYIFAAVPASIIKNSGMSEKIAEKLLPNTAQTAAASLALYSAFGFSFLITFVVGSTTSIATTLIAAFAPTLLAFGESTLIYAALFAWIGAIMGMAFSPNNGILRASLEKGQTSYKQFFKKTWILGLIMLAASAGLVFSWTRFVIKN